MKKSKHQNLGCILGRSKGEYCHIVYQMKGCLPSLISPLKFWWDLELLDHGKTWPTKTWKQWEFVIIEIVVTNLIDFWCLYSNSFMLLPHIKSGKKRNHGYVDIQKWNGEGIPHSILVRNLQQFWSPKANLNSQNCTHNPIFEVQSNNLFIYLFIYLGEKPSKGDKVVFKWNIFFFFLLGKKFALKAQNFFFWGGGFCHICTYWLQFKEFLEIMLKSA